MTAIFISYRRQDTKQIAFRIFEKLEDRLGGGSAFIDMDRIPFGVDFHTYLDEAVARARIVLVLIGPGWAEAKDGHGRRRLDNPDDFVRIEIESALKRNIPMGAVLIDGAPMPRAEQLPESMRPLVRRNAAFVDAGRDFHVHMDRLIKDLEVHLKGRAGGSLPAAPVTRPAWARVAGRDSFGQWAEFALGGATQRMRWIEPGRFLMGSPEDEPGRYNDEGPRHEVRLSSGFWLLDTPVTQELWTAAMGDNPSRFKHPKRPVEQVSWDDAGRFLQRVNSQVPGLDLVLPTEAQWEYACRAGTATPNYAGSEKDLADIAWFFENSGLETQPVAAKRCNAWGLYDMLGNVWEWCADGRRNYTAEPATDPAGALDGASRAVRGGSWHDFARGVRAAYRYAFHREYRSVSIGFRCARVRQ